MKFDFKKFINGFNIFDGEKRGKIIFFAILILIGGFIMWSAFIKPTTDNTQKVVHDLAAKVINIENYNAETKQETVVSKIKLEPFVEVYGYLDKQNKGVGVRCGIKF